MAGDARRGLRFRPRARLMNTLGRELISGDTVALTELVKNSYDADAGLVVVSVSGEVGDDGAVAAETGRIIVLDDGHGMDADRIVETWLEPATSFRRSQRPGPSGRRVLGEKGVGRFAAAKLGDQMVLTSKTCAGQEVHLRLDWRDFEDDSKYLEDIEIDLLVGETRLFDAGGEAEQMWRVHAGLHGGAQHRGVHGPGTLVEITSLHSRWTSDLATDVRRSLSRLVSPFAEQRGIVGGFTIVLDLPESLGTGGVVSSADLLGQHHYSLSAEVGEDGAATVLLTLKDGSEQEREVEVRNQEGGEGLRCGPFEIFLHVWDRDAESMSSLADRFGGSRLARDALDAACGVSIYRDGFRVLPYGETGDDWLSLDAHRVQNPTRNLSNNQIVGYVLIGRGSNPELIDQSNREGLVEGPALADLRHAVRTLLSTIEIERFRFRPRQPRRVPGMLLEPIDLTQLRDAVSEATPGDDRLRGMVEDAQREFDEHFQRVTDVLARYHRLATLGRLTDQVVHELTQPIFAIRQSSSLGIETLNGIPEAGREAVDHVMDEDDVLDALDAKFHRIKDQADTANTVVKRIEPFGGRGRGRPSRYVLETAMSDAINVLASQINEAGAAVSLPDTAHTVTIDRAELQEILVNLIDNSLYWMRQSRTDRAIALSVEDNDDGSLAIVVEDSGPGIPAENTESIFEPYFSTKPDGVGLGLAITGEIVEDYYGGSLELLSPGHLGGARFRATLRKRVA